MTLSRPLFPQPDLHSSSTRPSLTYLSYLGGQGNQSTDEEVIQSIREGKNKKLNRAIEPSVGRMFPKKRGSDYRR
jgi:hypothetical protein